MQRQQPSQNKSVLAWLQKGKTITAAEAERRWNVYRLAARIGYLRSQGHPIKTEMRKNRHNHGFHAVYYL